MIRARELCAAEGMKPLGAAFSELGSSETMDRDMAEKMPSNALKELILCTQLRDNCVEILSFFADQP